MENDKVITDEGNVCEILNDYYVNIAKNIGIENEEDDIAQHQDVEYIANNHPQDTFQFDVVDEVQVYKKLKEINPKKATGPDDIPPKLVKLGSPVLAPIITKVINYGITTSNFPSSLKMANVSPVYKKNDNMSKGNYRPVSVLPTISKIFESILADQLSIFLETVYNPFTAAFRKQHSCQSVLIKIIEDWKQALDQNKYVGAVLMDLSKAFDCLPHNLLLAKLKAYGLTDHSINLLRNYLSNRRQRVKIGNNCSEWQNITKGVPQGSILGPILFNIFLNDIFASLNETTLYNYADDNTICNSDENIENVKSHLVSMTKIAIDWFERNCMQANPEKFQAIFLAPGHKKVQTDFSIDNINIKLEKSVKLLGVELDDKLKFDIQVSSMCKKAAKQLNALKRIGHLLDQSSRLSIFRAYIMSNFNYCPLVWHFCSKKNLSKLERIQERALRFVYRDYKSSYEKLLDQAKLQSLHLGRLRSLATEIHKAVHGGAPPYVSSLFTERESEYSLRRNHSLILPPYNTISFGKQSIRYTGPKVWNSLPNNLRQTTSLKEFKNLISTWSGTNCTCSLCCYK